MLGNENMQRKILEYVEIWKARGYPEGIPDEADPILENFNKVPSFRMICRAIMKNDVALLTLGYSRQPCAIYNSLKREELILRGDFISHDQYELFSR